jgi:hypothetical protein
VNDRPAVVARPAQLARCVAIGGFDLDHIGTQVGEQLAGCRDGNVLTEFDHAQAFQRRVGVVVGGFIAA